MYKHIVMVMHDEPEIARGFNALHAQKPTSKKFVTYPQNT